MNKKNNTIIIIIAIVILVIISLITIKNRNQKMKEPVNQTEIDLNQAVNMDSSSDIKTSLDEIDITDTSEADLNIVDQELQNL